MTPQVLDVCPLPTAPTSDAPTASCLPQVAKRPTSRGKEYRSHVADDPNFGIVSHFAFPADGSNPYNKITGNFVKGSGGSSGYPKVNAKNGTKCQIHRRYIAEGHSECLSECPVDPSECPSACHTACLSSQCCLPLGGAQNHQQPDVLRLGGRPHRRGRQDQLRRQQPPVFDDRRELAQE